MKTKLLSLVLAALLALAGCSARSGGGENLQGSVPPGGESAVDRAALGSDTPVRETEPAPPASTPAADDYIANLAGEIADGLIEPGMSEYERTKAAFDYMIEHTVLYDPVGLDLWQIRGHYEQAPSFVDNRALSALAFGIGKCEDYAAGLTVLLRAMGLEAEYVPGLTYSTQGALVDHAWTVVRIDGVWYHLDCQLEQNISRNGSVRYKYFLRGDATMARSHRWGQNLINTGLLRADQNEELARDYLYEACPQDYPTPERRSVTLPPAPDLGAIEAQIASEWQAYEREHGPVTRRESNIIPPVFALEGYGPQD